MTDGALELTHRRIFIVPTKRGLGLVLLIVILLLIAFIYNNNLAYLLTFLLASVFIITMLHTFKNLIGLVVQAGQTKSVFAGEAAGFDIHIDNPKRIARTHLQIQLDKAHSFSLAAHSKTCITLYSPAHKRGWHELPKVTLFSTYPLGLFYAWSPMRFNTKALVYPKPSNLDLPFPQTPDASGENGFQLKGADDFYGLQQYQAGDAIKHIHWKAFAKGQGLYSKQYAGATVSKEIWLYYYYAGGYTVEERLSQLCRWVLDAERAEIRYGLVLPNSKLNPDCGSVHFRQCLEALALL